MKEEYENRLQRAKNKLNEEKARRKSRDALRDDASYCSEMSKTSRNSFTSEFSRASSKHNDSNKLPRSEWRNKARAVIERGKSKSFNREQESDPVQDDVSHKEREAQIDSLVERNALLNERERMLKVENHLLDAAEAAAKAEELQRAESYLGKGIEDDGEDFSLNSESQQSQLSAATTRTTATTRAKRIQDKEADELNRSFQQAQKVWQGRCKPKKSGLDDPTPVKSNTYKATTGAKKNMPSLKIEANSSDDTTLDDELLQMTDSDDTTKTDEVVAPPGSPASVKSTRSTRSVKSVKSAKSEQLFNSRGKAVVMRSSVLEAPSSPESVKSDFISRAKEIGIMRSISLLESEHRDGNMDTENGPTSASDRRSTSSYRQKRDDPLSSYEGSTEKDLPPSQPHRLQTSSSASVSSQRSKHSRHGHDDTESKAVDTGSKSYRVKSSSGSVASERSKYSSYRTSNNEDRDPSSSVSVSSQRSKYSSSRSRGDKVPPSSSISVSSQRSHRSKHSSHREQSPSATVSSQRSAYSLSRKHRSSGASVSSQRSRRSLYHDDELDEDDFANMLPDELSIPMIIADLDNGENQPPSQKRELSYREKSAMLASMENNNMAEESGPEELEDGPRDRNTSRQHDQKVVKKHQQSPYMSVALYGSGIQPQPKPQPNVVLPALKEQKNLYNTKAETNTALKAQQVPETMELSNLINENRELKARLEREQARRSQLDDKTTNLQLEVHQKGEEISQLKQRKDVSATHKEQLYKLEDALHEANRRLAVVMDENAGIRAELEEEHARRGRLEAQAKHYQTKLKKRSDEVVGLARELKKKDDRFSQAVLEERHLREVAEAQLAKACQHINISEREQNEELDELEKENQELRHTVHRLEVYLKQKLEKERQAKTKNRRQSGGSNQDGISSKPTWTTSVSAVSEITTDFECDELNSSQMGEI